MKGRITKLGAVALATAIGFATVATLVQAADPITVRREAMKSNGAAMKAINETLEKGGTAADLAPHAAKVNEVAMKVATLFPAGSDQPQGKDPGQTMAKAEIWQNPDDFATKVKAFQDEAAMFNTAVAGGDMAVIKAEFEKLGGACGGCHKVYRAK
ncbi:MAG TPA: cytochrome c [Dongiaceae bacterium]|jgi:cytochrome c556|nr:cytochrome c [Dongiaceae bacterium]